MPLKSWFLSLRTLTGNKETRHDLRGSRVRSLVVACLVAFPANAAHAFCSEGYGYDFASKISGYLDYLVCLHNEQSDALNEQARLINSHADGINELISRQNEIAELMGALSDMTNDLAAKMSDLEFRIDYLEFSRPVRFRSRSKRRVGHSHTTSGMSFWVRRILYRRRSP